MTTRREANESRKIRMAIRLCPDPRAHTGFFPPCYFPHFGLFPAIFQGMVAPPIDHVPPGVLPDQHIMFPVFIERFESISPDNLLVFVALLCKVKYSILIGDHFRLSVTNPDSTEGVAREHLGAPWVHSGCTKGAHKVHQGALRVHSGCTWGASGCIGVQRCKPRVHPNAPRFLPPSIEFPYPTSGCNKTSLFTQ